MNSNCESGRLTFRRRRLLAGAIVVSVAYASPALAEVCDKGDGGQAGLFGLVMMLATVSGILAARFGALWPSYTAAGLMFLLAAAGLSDVLSDDPFAAAAWREGCAPRNMAVTVICGVGLIVVGRWARTHHKG